MPPSLPLPKFSECPRASFKFQQLQLLRRNLDKSQNELPEGYHMPLSRCCSVSSCDTTVELELFTSYFFLLHFFLIQFRVLYHVTFHGQFADASSLLLFSSVIALHRFTFLVVSLIDMPYPYPYPILCVLPSFVLCSCNPLPQSSFHLLFRVHNPCFMSCVLISLESLTHPSFLSYTQATGNLNDHDSDTVHTVHKVYSIQ